MINMMLTLYVTVTVLSLLQDEDSVGYISFSLYILIFS